MTAPQSQAPTSALKKDATSRADLARASSVFFEALKIVGFGIGPVAFTVAKADVEKLMLDHFGDDRLTQAVRIEFA